MEEGRVQDLSRLPSRATVPSVSIPIDWKRERTREMLESWLGMEFSTDSRWLLLASFLPVFIGMFGPPSCDERGKT